MKKSKLGQATLALIEAAKAEAINKGKTEILEIAKLIGYDKPTAAEKRKLLAFAEAIAQLERKACVGICNVVLESCVKGAELGVATCIGHITHRVTSYSPELLKQPDGLPSTPTKKMLNVGAFIYDHQGNFSAKRAAKNIWDGMASVFSEESFKNSVAAIKKVATKSVRSKK